MPINLEESYPLSGGFGKLLYNNTNLFLSTNDTIKAFSLDPINLITSITVGLFDPYNFNDSSRIFAGIYWDGTYLYHHNVLPLNYWATFYVYFQAYTFDGNSFNKISEDVKSPLFCTPNIGSGICGDGTYIFRAYFDFFIGSIIEAFKWNAGTLVSDGTASLFMTPNTIRMMHYQNGFIFSSASDYGLQKISYSSPNFTVEKEDTSYGYADVSGDGTYIYVGRHNENVIDAYDEDLNLIASYIAAPPDAPPYNVVSVKCDGGYIFASFYNHGFKILSFNGTSFTVEESVNDGSSQYFSVIGE